MTADAALKRKKVVSPKWIWVRRLVQTFFLLVFLYLLVATIQGITGRLPNDLFFLLDPLTGISAFLASRNWIAPAMLGILTLVLAVIIGRAWCGWVCPLGTLLDWTPSRRQPKNPAVSPVWSQGKYLLFFAIILGAVMGSLALIVLDPITILFRTFAGVILPGLNQLIGSAETWLYGFKVLEPALDGIDGALRGWLLNNQPFYLANLWLLAVLAVVLALNALRSRFWCRYLCPLGGMLGLISKVAFIRHRVDAEKCISCRKCSSLCPTGAICPEHHFAANISECTVCLNCKEGCPVRAISFGKAQKSMYSQNTQRRWLLSSLGAAVVAAVFFRFIPSLTAATNKLIRPPGSTEASLNNQCIRCGECVRVCPTGAIQPSQKDSPSKLWTPVLETRRGYCDYSCNSCGAICPTGAIASLPLETKRKTVIGLAKIDQTRCITWAEERDCIVCEEMCPIPDKAIRLGGGGGGGGSGRGGRGGGSGQGRHPQVIAELCTGCGICEQQCPVAGESAIRIFPPET